MQKRRASRRPPEGGTQSVVVTPADLRKLECTYDTTSRTERVFRGEGTQDEMCLVFAYVRARHTDDTTSRAERVFWAEGTQDEMCLVFSYVTRAQGTVRSASCSTTSERAQKRRASRRPSEGGTQTVCSRT